MQANIYAAIQGTRLQATHLCVVVMALQRGCCCPHLADKRLRLVHGYREVRVRDTPGQQTQRPECLTTGYCTSNQLCHMAHTTHGKWVGGQRLPFNLCINFITK